MNQQELNELFYYDNGKLFNKVDRARNAKAGEEAGTLNKDGYRRCMVNRKRYLAHRLIYTLLKGDIPAGLQIDHINNDKLDNRIGNLRLVTRQENAFNTSAKGFYWHKVSGKFMARICKNGKNKTLGYFDTPEEASQAYLTAKAQLHQIQDRGL